MFALPERQDGMGKMLCIIVIAVSMFTGCTVTTTSSNGDVKTNSLAVDVGAVTALADLASTKFKKDTTVAAPDKTSGGN